MYQSQVKALAWVPPLARCQGSLCFHFRLFAGNRVCAGWKALRRNWGRGWSWGVPRSALQARLVPLLLCHHQSLRAITTHQQFLKIRPSQLGEEILWYFPASLSKYAITIILWTFTATFHTRGWVLHRHSFSKQHTTCVRKLFFFILLLLQAGSSKGLSTHFVFTRDFVFFVQSIRTRIKVDTEVHHIHAEHW